MPFDGTIYNHPASIIDRMRRIFGRKGEHWTVGCLYDHDEDAYCLLGALGAAQGVSNQMLLEQGPPNYNEPVAMALAQAIEDEEPESLDFARSYIVDFNDDQTEFKAIRAILTKARRILVSKYGKVVA